MAPRVFFKSRYLNPVTKPLLKNAGMLVENGKILKCDTLKNFEEWEYQDAQIFEYPNALIMPGLINAHTHLEYTLLGRIYTKKFVDFLVQSIQKTLTWDKNKVTESVKAGIRQSLECGVTTVGDISKWGLSPIVLSESPLFANVALEAFSYDEQSAVKAFDKLKEKLTHLQERVEPHVTLSMSPHSTFTADDKLWALMIDYTLDHGMILHSHIAESLEEKKWFEGTESEIDALHKMAGWPKLSPKITHLSPVEYLNSMELMPDNLLAAHLCFASGRDIELIRGKNMTVVVCPRSNLNLHKKMLDYYLFDKYKIRLALGTDATTSAGTLNFLEDIRLFQERNGLPVETLTKLVTINAAQALKMDDRVGSLEPGKYANIAVFDGIDSPDNWYESLKPKDVFIKGENIHVSAL